MPPNLQQTVTNPRAHKAGKRTVIAGLLSISLLTGALLTVYQQAKTPQTVDQTAAAALSKPNAFKHIDITAQSALVLDMTTGEELYSKNPNAQLPLASITKVMLALVVAEELPDSATIQISEDAYARAEGGLPRPGERWKKRSLLDYTLITSSNVGAEALAEATNAFIGNRYASAPNEKQTVWRMNIRAQELGLSQTFYQNASGLDISTTLASAYGSARDMAKLFAFAAKEYSDVFESTTENGVLLSSLDGTVQEAENTNDALGSIPGLIMGKTGTTDLAGGNLGLVFEVGPAHPIAIVILGSGKDARFTDAKKLIAATYQQMGMSQ